MDIVDVPIYEATHRGYVQIGDKEIPCAVLENGQRIISQTGLFQTFDRPTHGAKRAEGLPSIVSAQNFLEFVTPEFQEKAEIIHYKHVNGRVAKGYNAEIIPMICELYIEANRENKLHASQVKLVDRAVTIILALSKIGITALIDEATGYQEDRDRKELQILLSAYLSENLLDWTSRFPLEYYEEIYRLHGWDLDPKKSRRPQYIGTFTNKYVWDFFPEEVLEEIKKQNPVKSKKGYRRNRFHQYLTEDIGIRQLDEHLNRLITSMKLSDDLDDFKNKFAKIFSKEIERMDEKKKIKYTPQIQQNLTLF